MARYHLPSLLVIVTLLCSGLLVHPPGVRAAEACFAETNQCVRGRFLEYWLTNGGLARNGFPLSEERRELLEDGQEHTVQYFERVRLESHPENEPPYDVLLGQFGRRVLTQNLIAARTSYHIPRLAPDVMQPAAPLPARTYFHETGHNLGGRFLAYWQENGGLAQFGYPLTEEVEETLWDGAHTVQYFERARFEHHPKNADPRHQVLLGQFGRRILAQVDNLADNADFFALYMTNGAVRERLGAPRWPANLDVPIWSPSERAPGATQAFEQGQMFFLHRRYQSGGTIYVLCGAPSAGRVLGQGWQYFFSDTDTGDDPGGGPAPVPGLYEPKRGFGTLWREHAAVRECLGYATAADETAYTIAAREFQAGLMFTSPDDTFIYVLFVERSCPGCGEASATYERFEIRPR